MREDELDTEMFGLFDDAEGVDTPSAAAAGGGNPWLTAGMVGLKTLQAHKKREEVERMERHKAQMGVQNSMSRALVNLTNIGRTIGI